MLKPVLSYYIHFYTDFHVGTGDAIPGIVDDIVLRRQDDLLYIPGHTIKGMARDGADRLLVWSGSHRFMKTLAEVFGEPGTGTPEGRYLFNPAFLVDFCPDLSQPPGHPPKKIIAKEYLSYISRRHHNAIDPKTGRAKEDFFFSREVGWAHLEFEGQVLEQCLGTDPDRGCDPFRLLVTSLCLIETIGGKRTRGEGWCLVRPKDPPQEEVVKKDGIIDQMLSSLAQREKKGD